MTSDDGLFEYRLEGDPDRVGSWSVVVVACQADEDSTVFAGFASREALMSWVEAHSSADDLGSFALLRASRAMHEWARKHRRELEVDSVARWIEESASPLRETSLAC